MHTYIQVMVKVKSSDFAFVVVCGVFTIFLPIKAVCYFFLRIVKIKSPITVFATISRKRLKKHDLLIFQKHSETLYLRRDKSCVSFEY